MSELRVEGLCKRFGGAAVLEDVDLAVPSGRLVAILGRSGSGKTTLLRIIGGFERTDAGRVLVAGEVVSSGGRGLPPERRRIGYVPQEGALFPHLTVGDNVVFGLPRRARRAARSAADLLALVGLPADYVGRYPHQLSGGEQQRAALARALAPEPQLLLLDEPFSSLDAALRAETREAVAGALAAVGATAILVTHDQAEALSMGSQVAVLRAGRVVQFATPDLLYRRPVDLALARFVGEAMVLPGLAGSGRVTCALGTLPLAAGALEDPVPEGRVVVMLRPEQLELTPARPAAASGTAASARPTARVDAVTFYGPDAQVRLLLLPVANPVELVARTPGHLAPAIGDIVAVRVTGEVTTYPADP